ncbi:hypothetical protein, partial [Microbacterium sp. VKM Ac-2923]|uniref:hypothetical protein n=1 Tax=Microbacterium sp. VKM Ac-2923 TaxID=2929476 RepID=UPI001FB327FB
MSVTSSVIDKGVSVWGAKSAVTVTGNTVRDGDVQVTRYDGAEFAFGVTVTGNTVQRGSVQVSSANASGNAPAIRVTGNTITGNTSLCALKISDVKLRPSNLTGNTITGNQPDTFCLNGTLVENWTVPTAGPRIVVTFDAPAEGLTVAAGVTMTAPAGTIIKFQPGAWSGTNLTVAGSLVANGTSASPVVFTSLYD